MNAHLRRFPLTLSTAICLAVAAAAEPPRFQSELIFPLHPKHNHAPGIVECPNGDLLVSWYRGSGERKADDVSIHVAHSYSVKGGKSMKHAAFNEAWVRRGD